MPTGPEREPAAPPDGATGVGASGIADAISQMQYRELTPADLLMIQQMQAAPMSELRPCDLQLRAQIM